MWKPGATSLGGGGSAKRFGNCGMENPWKTLASDVKYDNPWIRVTEHQVLNPNGGPGIYGVVQFKNLALGVIPVFPDGTTVLVGQYRYPLSQYSWEIPEGGGKMGIEPLESARRELKEETGLVATEYTEVLRMHLSNSVSDELAIIYVATGLTQEEPEPEPTEQLVLRRVPLDEAYRMACRAEITDAMSIAGLIRVWDMLRNGELEVYSCG
jgi:8-oxo-dGTP pyrophosphatase MutT (NUDIX family)